MQFTGTLFLLLLGLNFLSAQDLQIINEDYDLALATAAREDKLIFVDFYTVWCGPCKELDKMIFTNDSIRRILAEDFVLLKYDAEKDSVHHLSKKHHVMSYPTGLILNAEGYVLNRKYGFPGEDFNELAASVMAFTEQGVTLNKEDKTLVGYSNTIDASRYPAFYNDYVNRTDTKVDSAEFAAYWASRKDPFAEEYFSTLIYFASDGIPDEVTDFLLNNRAKYSGLFGSTDVDIALMFISFSKFDAAVASVDAARFDAAVAYARKALDTEFAESVITRYTNEMKEKKQKD